jgi:16S rRNA (cytidine1402-2'-O)-methyltransferase
MLPVKGLPTLPARSGNRPLSPEDWGKFYVVATPLGNTGDITLRALEILKSSEEILCENAKNTIPLLRNLGIETRARTLFRFSSGSGHSEEEFYASLLDGIQSGKSYALVSDAGTPGVSDPGSQVVRFLRTKGISAIPIPGPSALSAILSVSGFQANPTLFLGFLSEKKGKKTSQLREASACDGLIVFYESVHKMPVTLEILEEVFPNQEILIGRELTKIHEELIYYEKSSLWRENPPTWKGEFTVLVNNHKKFSLKQSRESPILGSRG